MNDSEMRAMLIEYMGKGFLENISALLKTDDTLFRFIPDLVADDAIMVRLGATALIEELAKDRPRQLRAAIPGLLELLRHENATIRGDAANALGIIGDPQALDALRALANDGSPQVKEVAAEAVREIESSGN